MSTETIDHTDHIVRLQRILRVVENNPDQWNQSWWLSFGGATVGLPMKHDPDLGKDVVDEEACGTAFCFAGWAAHLEPTVRWLGSSVLIDATTQERWDVARWACDYFGLSVLDGDRLFRPGNTLSDLRRLVAEYTGNMLDEMYPPPPVKQWDVVVVRKENHRLTVSGADEQAASAAALAEFNLSKDDESVIDVVVTEHVEVDVPW